MLLGTGGVCEATVAVSDLADLSWLLQERGGCSRGRCLRSHEADLRGERERASSEIVDGLTEDRRVSVLWLRPHRAGWAGVMLLRLRCAHRLLAPARGAGVLGPGACVCEEL